MDIKTIKVKQGLDIKFIQSQKPQPIINDNFYSDSLTDKLKVCVVSCGGSLIRSCVNIGDRVKASDKLFDLIYDDKIQYRSSVSGRVDDFIYDGRKRIGVVVEVEDRTDIIRSCSGVPFSPSLSLKFPVDPLSLEVDQVKSLLLESGTWNFFRQRPFSIVPRSSSLPSSICINAMDQDPLPLDIDLVVSSYDVSDYALGARVLFSLCSNVFLCSNETTFKKLNDRLIFTKEKIRLFEGSYPCGLSGTHIHYLDPVYESKPRFPWYIDIEDVFKIGHFFKTSTRDFTKIISVCGDIQKPQYLRIVSGTGVSDISCVKGFLKSNNMDSVDQALDQFVIGSVLCGKSLTDTTGRFLSWFDKRVVVLSTDNKERLWGWMRPEPRRYSFYNTNLSKLIRSQFKFSNKNHGTLRPIFPMESFKDVFVFDKEPMFLLKSLSVYDTGLAIKLGCLELDEEDLGLCSFIDPSKTDYGDLLRKNLDIIQDQNLN